MASAMLDGSSCLVEEDKKTYLKHTANLKSFSEADIRFRLVYGTTPVTMGHAHRSSASRVTEPRRVTSLLETSSRSEGGI